MIRPRLHSRAGQTPLPGVRDVPGLPTTSFSLLLSGLVLLGPEWSADGLRSLEIHAGLCLPAASPRASRAGDLSGMWWPKARVDLWVWNLHPQGLWGPAGWLPASDLWALGPGRAEGAGQRCLTVGRGRDWHGSCWEIPSVLSLGP